MTLDEAIGKVAEDLGIPKDRVNKIYKGYWRAIREHVTSMPFKKDLTDEEFLKLQPNVNIPSIGKLYVTLERYKKKNESWNLTHKNNGTTYKED